MFAYGAAPAADQIEITLFGPGYGEAIAAHLGGGQWVLIDSCRPFPKGPVASLDYLNRIGADLAGVRTIVASHWHSDHVSGMSEIVTACPGATFVMPGILTDRDARAYIAYFSGVPSQAKGTTEISRALEAQPDPLRRIYAMQRMTLLEARCGPRMVVVSALSPTTRGRDQEVARLRASLPATGMPIANAPDVAPNVSSVVIHIDIEGHDALLFGSDLENAQAGWPDVVADAWCAGKRSAKVFKVSHHGSHTGHLDEVWTELIEGKPLGVLTPFINGRVSLPTSTDKARLATQLSTGYSASTMTTRAKMDPNVLKRLGDIAIDIHQINAGFGCVRMRSNSPGEDWQVELFGHAGRL